MLGEDEVIYDGPMSDIDSVEVLDGPPPIRAVPIDSIQLYSNYRLGSVTSAAGSIVDAGKTVYESGDKVVAAYEWWSKHQRKIKIGATILGGVVAGLIIWRVVFK